MTFAGLKKEDEIENLVAFIKANCCSWEAQGVGPARPRLDPRPISIGPYRRA